MAGLLHLHDQGARIVIQAYLVADSQDSVRVVRLDARQKASQRERLRLSGHDLSFSFFYAYGLFDERGRRRVPHRILERKDASRLSFMFPKNVSGGASTAMVPPSMKTMRSAASRAKPSSCVTMTIVMPVPTISRIT